MSRHLPVAPFLIVAFGLTVIPAGLRAQTIPAACRPLIDAEEKQIMTSSHVYMTRGADNPGGKPTTHETIATGGAIYVQFNGHWMRSPMTAQQLLDQLKQNLTTTKVYSCQHVGDETVGGMSAAVYTAHAESDALIADTRAWIAKGTGLPLRSEEDIQIPGQSGKQHMSIRYEYSNVQAPAVAK